ncbi:E3 ubiquitin-protein ligase TRIM47-like [Centropristis striata]|uniref:E3 ubiquitin-protein ligase TRIM47-like n=1 Tax=Centropristis striata TaxID=184440 RepID=UPI0027E18AC7|nr:E3 ubiquitin-protein ligase TRIM47-like [Centropristis striata]
MATAGSFLSEDQFLCSICLDVFTEPVSIPCGHNFCKACLSRHWEGKEQCQCPMCKEEFHKGFKLRVNTGYRDVVENFKEHHAKADNNSLVKPGQVPCDCCLGNKFKASKTCLVCLTSYCETHLEPHLRVAALKRHKLTDPVHNLEDQICKKHNRLLELFCRYDQTCVCVQCTEHSSHDTVPLEKAYVDKKAHMGKKKAEVQQNKNKRGKRAQKKKVPVQTMSKDVVANSVVSNQMQGPPRWWIPNQFHRFGYFSRNSGGRFYHEVPALWSTSLDSEPLRGVSTFIPDPGSENWVIRLGTGSKCKRPNIPIHLFSICISERVMAVVDYDEGLVSFFHADTAEPIVSYTGCKFNEMIYMFYHPTPTLFDRWELWLRNKFEKIKEWSQSPEALICFVFFYFALCWMWPN